LNQLLLNANFDHLGILLAVAQQLNVAADNVVESFFNANRLEYLINIGDCIHSFWVFSRGVIKIRKAPTEQ